MLSTWLGARLAFVASVGRLSLHNHIGARMIFFIRVIIAISFTICCSFSLAQTQLHVRSDFEAGVAQHQNGNIKMAIIFFEQGANKGDPKSMFALGTYYYFGEGVDQNFVKAKSLFESAAEKDEAEANTMLGLMYQKGEGVSADLSRAKVHYTKAANACDATAQNLLAQILYYGEAGPAEKSEALAWLYLAAPHNSEAAGGVAHVEKEMSGDEVKAAKLRKTELEAKLVCQN